MFNEKQSIRLYTYTHMTSCHFVVKYSLFEAKSLFPLYSATEGYCPRRAAVAMGENMSKRLKLISSSEAEMEERSFPNRFPDWDQRVVTSNSGADIDYNDPFDEEGKVRAFVFSTMFVLKITPC